MGSFPETYSDPSIPPLWSAAVRCLFINVVTSEVGCSFKLQKTLRKQLKKVRPFHVT